MKTSAIFFVFALFASGHAFADSVVGSYYEPSNEEEGQPESLMIFKDDGTYESRTVDAGRQEVYAGRYRVEGDQLFLGKLEGKAVCLVLDHDYSEAASGRFVRTANSITLFPVGAEKQVAKVATPEEERRVLDLPLCGK